MGPSSSPLRSPEASRPDLLHATAKIPTSQFIQHHESREKAYAVAQKIKAYLATRKSYEKILDINDVKQRYILVRENTRKEIKQTTGADVTVLGKWVPVREYATEKEPVLMLRVIADTPEKLDAALRKLDELMGIHVMPALTARSSREDPEAYNVNHVAWFIDGRCDIPIDNVPGFNLRGKLVGPNGSYLKHVSNETGCRVQLKGIGSGYVDGDGREGAFPLYMHLCAQSNDDIAKGKKMCEDLLKSVRVEYEMFMEQKRALEPMLGMMGGGQVLPPGSGQDSEMGMAPPGLQMPPGGLY